MRAAPRAASASPYKRPRFIAGFVTGNFPRDRRIVKTDDFSSVFRLRPSQRTVHFVLYTRSSRLPQARLGIVVAKRFAPRAVTRNMIKRLCREAFRHSAMPPADCIVRLAAPVGGRAQPASSASLKAQLRQELQQLFTPKVFAEKSL